MEIQLESLRKRLAERMIGLEMTSDARRFIAETSYDPVYGARPLKRYLQKHVETELGKKIIRGEILDGSRVRIVLKRGELDFEVEPGAVEEALRADLPGGLHSPKTGAAR